MSTVDTKGRNVDLGWDAIDIFLFSNGQKSTPPRKYHLQTNELNWWEATLNYLAKSHFGTSQTAIELYTLDGKKVEGPFQLSDGSPYVAVIPPDTFTNAGYDHYLMKASRSWEKRNAKKENIGVESEVKCSGPLRISTVELVPVSELNIVKPPEEPYEPVSSVLVKPEQLVTKKSDKPAARQPPKGIIPRNERKRTNGIRTSFLKNSPPAVVPPKRNSSVNKEDIHSKTYKRISIKTNDTVSSAPEKAKGTAKSVNNKPPQSSLTISKPASPEKSKAMMTVNSKGFVTDSLSIRDLINDKEILVIATDIKEAQNVVTNLNVLRAETYHPSTVDEITDCSIPPSCMEIETQTTIEMSTREVNTTPNLSHSTNSKIKVISPNRNLSPSNALNCDVPLGDNCIAVINKGEAVNLKFNIELQNSSQTYDYSNNSHKTVRKANSLSDLFKQRQSIQSDVEAAVPTKSLESVIYDINDCYAKIVLIQCSCCGNKTAIPRITKDPNGFFILMPTEGQYGTPSCLCCPNHERLCPEKAAMSSCVDDLCKPNSSTVYPCVTQNVGMVMTITGSIASQTGDYNRRAADLCLMSNPRLCNDVICYNKDPNSTEERGTSSCQIMNIECVTSATNTPRTMPYPHVDSYTQTDWCRVLLEAQRHNDGRYSLHLPPLHMLKRYSLV